MKKNRSVALFLVLSMGVSLALTSCKDSNTTGNSDLTIELEDSVQKLEENKINWTGGIHGGTETPLESYVLKDGKTDYKIVIPQDAEGMEEYAAFELQQLFLEATGVKLPIVTDEDATSADKIFSLGRTKQFADTGVSVDKYELRDDGFKIVTVSDDIYMCGGEAMGTVYAVYEYLYRTLNFEQFYVDCYTLDKNVKDLQLCDYAIVERPDIGFRASSYAFLDSNTTVRYRMRVSGSMFSCITPVGAPCHNSFSWLPLDEHYEEHNDWYSLDKTQLCYTARGNEESLNAMLDACLERFKEVYAVNPDTKALSLSLQDYRTWCSCDACAAESAKYGTDSAVVIKFLNKLSKKMEAYVTELHKDDPDFVYDIDLLFFAYNSTTGAPVTYDKVTNTYKAIDETVVCDPHVAPWYAPIYLDYTQKITDEINTTYYNNMYAWDTISETMYLWTYETNFWSYLSPYESFNGMTELFQVMAQVNAAYVLNQSQYNQEKGATAWHILKAYLTSKLSWDSTQSMGELIDRFFNAMYGPAAGTMKTWFNSTRGYTQKLMSEGKYKGLFSTNTRCETEEFWSYTILNTWSGYSDKALSEIEKLKTVDPEAYALYYERIVMERISVNYLMLQIYESRLSKAQAKELFDTILTDAELCGITRYHEAYLLSDWANEKELIY